MKETSDAAFIVDRWIEILVESERADGWIYRSGKSEGERERGEGRAGRQS